MKHSSRKFLPLAILALILFFLGQWLYKPVFELLEPRVGEIRFEIVEHSHLLRTSLIFSILLALIPIAIALNWRFANIDSLKNKVLSILIILLFVALAIFMRRAMVRTYFTKVVVPALSHQGRSDFNYPIDPVNFIYYMFAGLLTGFVISFFIFQSRNRIRPSGKV